MTEVAGPTLPLHRRFNEARSLELIRNRYRNFRTKLARQVPVLQEDRAFRAWVQDRFYVQGFKDWVLLSVVFNQRLNWEARKLGIPIGRAFVERANLLAEIVEYSIEPPQRFLDNDGDLAIALNTFDATCLVTYGFEYRKPDFEPTAVRNFLRQRMRHYELDLPHDPMFGEPPGRWPDCEEG